MAKFNRNAPLEDQVFQVHECLEDLKNKVLPLLQSSQEEIKSVRRGNVGLARRINKTVKATEGLEDKITEAVSMATAAASRATSTEIKLDTLNTNAWKLVLTIIGAVVVAGIVAISGMAYQYSINQTTFAHMQANQTAIEHQAARP